MASAGVAGGMYKVSCHARRAAPRPASCGPRRGLLHAARALSRRPGGLRRHLPRAPGRRGPHLGGPLHDPRGARAQGLHAPRAGRRHRDRLPDMAGPARRRAVGRRRLLAAPALRARRRRSGHRLRGPVPPAQRSPAAGARPRRPAAGPPGVDADDGRRPRRRVHPRAGRDQGLVLRHRGRAHARGLSRPRARPTGLRRLFKAPRRPVLGALVRRDRDRGDGRAGGRARPPGRQLDGRPRGDRDGTARARARRQPRAARARGGLRQARLAPDRAADASRARPAPAQPRAQPRRAPVLEPVRRPRPGRSQHGRRGRRRVPAHLRERRGAVGLPHGGAQHLSRTPIRARRLLPAAGRARSALVVRVGRRRPAHPARVQAPRGPVAARRRADRSRGLRPRPPGRAFRADDRAAAALLRPRRRARPAPGAGPGGPGGR
jgi:hypothetical protein